MNEEIKRKIEQAIRSNEEQQEDPRLLVLGATGAGKSSLINRVFGQELQEVNTIESTTRTFTTHPYQIDSRTRVLITDSPGYGEIGFDEEYRRRIIAESKSVHAVILVLEAARKGYKQDAEMIEATTIDLEASMEKPLLIALNKIDMLPPRRIWQPPYNLEGDPTPNDDPKVQNIKEKLLVVRRQFKKVARSRQLIVIPTMSEPKEGQVFGIDEFKLALFQALPEVSKYRFARAANLADNASRAVLQKLEQEAKAVINWATTAAATSLVFNPVPLSDYLVLAPIQVTMVVRIGAIYGEKIDETSALEILATLGAGFAARTVFQGFISLIPGIKNMIGPPFAAATTRAMGTAALAYFKGEAVPSQAELQAVIDEELEQHSYPS